MIFIGGLIVIATFVAIVKRYETRMVLFASGLLMCIVALDPIAAFDAFAARMVHSTLVSNICSVMGFAYVARLTKCDQHLVRLLTEPLKKLRPVLIPGAVLTTFVINIALTSAAGASAAVGAILIPTLMAAGVKPEMAATAVFAGTFGSTLSPGNSHNIMVSGIADMDPMSVISGHATAAIISVLIGAISLTIIGRVFKEDHGYEPVLSTDAVGSDVAGDAEIESVNLLKAFVTIFPLLLLILATPQVGLLPPVFNVPTSMLLGALLAVVITRHDPEEITKNYFAGMGHSYTNVIGIIIAASVFTTGMQAVGLTDALLEMMKRSTGIVNLSATFGPFIIAVLGGSGDAATLAFNEAITPHAAQFGLTIAHLGSVANVAGALGRTMSPVAGAAIICAGLADVNPIELSKRNAPGMVIAAIVFMLVMLVF